MKVNCNYVCLQLEAQLRYTEFQSRVRHLVTQIEEEQVVEPMLWRQIRYLAVIGPAALPPDQLERVTGFLLPEPY